MRLCTCGFANDDGRQACLACGNVLTVAAAEEKVGSAGAFPRDRDSAGGAGGCGASMLVAAAGSLESGSFVARGSNGGEEGRGAVEISRESRYDVPEPLHKQCGNRVLGLLDLRTNALVVVPAPGGVVGRAGDFEPDAFSSRVSGVHAVLNCDDEGRWTIEHVGRNGSSVERGGSWVPLRTGQPQPLFGGELLKLADMVFRVSVADGAAGEACKGVESEAVGRGCQEEGLIAESNSTSVEGGASINQNVEGAENAEESATMWSVRCPVCGTEHPVEGPQDRVAQCVFCQDPFDRIRIARVLPRRVPVPVQGE